MRTWLLIVLTSVVVACAGAGRERAATNARAGTAPIASGDHGRGVSLTGGGEYGDRHDPSGWSGVSTKPSAVGGGPLPATSAPASATPPAVVPSAAQPPVVTPPAAPTAPAMPPSKELDTAPPAKDLQF